MKKTIITKMGRGAIQLTIENSTVHSKMGLEELDTQQISLLITHLELLKQRLFDKFGEIIIKKELSEDE